MNFVDSNILLYAFGPDEGSDRPAMARGIIAEGDLAFSIQVFQEFFVQATHPRRKDPLTPGEARKVIASLSPFPLRANTLETFHDALGVQERFQISFWDAHIVAAARALKCEVIYSEDLNHGQDYGGVKVLNPFRP